MTTRYVGDLEPPLIVELSSPDDPVDVTPATGIRVIGRDSTRDIIFDRAPTGFLVVGSTSVITMDLQAGDTDTAGLIQVEVEVTWPVGRPQTFRPIVGLDVVNDFDVEDVP